MPDYRYPAYFNRETHIISPFFADGFEVPAVCDTFDKVPNTVLETFLKENDILIRPVLTSTRVTVLDSCVGFRGNYHRVKIPDIEEPVFIDRRNLEILSDEILRVDIEPNSDETLKIFDPVAPNGITYWNTRVENEVYFDQTSDKWYTTIITDFLSTGSPQVLEVRAREALIQGTSLILKYLGKRSDKEYCQKILFGTPDFKAFFEFSLVSGWDIDARPCSTLKFLVTIPNFFVTSDIIEEQVIPTDSIPSLSALGLSGLGAGNPNAVKKTIMIRMNGFNEFINHMNLVRDTVEEYSKLQDIFIDDYQSTHLTYLYDIQLKNLLNLDLVQEGNKLNNGERQSDLIGTVLGLLELNRPVDSNGVEQDFINIVYPDQKNIFLNHISFGFDENESICYVEVYRNGKVIPLTRFASDKFLKPVGENGFSSARSGFLLYQTSLDIFFATSNSDGSIISTNFQQIRQELTKYDYEQWVNDHIIPTPKQLNFPEKTIDCVKDVIQKTKDDARLIATNIDRANGLGAAFRNAQREKEREKSKKDPKVVSSLNPSADFSRLYPLDAVWRQIKNFHNDKNVRKLIYELAVCISRRMNYADFLKDISKFKSFSEGIRKFLIGLFCNKNVTGTLNIIGKLPVIPKVSLADPNAVFIDTLRNALSELLLKLYALIIQYIIDLIVTLCADPNAEFDANSGLNINDALQNALDDINGLNSPETNNLFDDLGYPIGGTVGANPDDATRATEADKTKLKNFIGDLTCILTTDEFCSIMVGGDLSGIKEQIVLNILTKRYPDLLKIFPTINEISNFLVSFGKALNVYDACLAYNRAREGTPAGNDTNRCQSKEDRQREIDQLLNKDIPEDLLKDLLDDLAKKRNDALLDLLNNLIRPEDEVIPVFCNFTPTGDVANQGIINAAKADPGYAKMFAENLGSQVSDVVKVFNSELREWKIKTIERSFKNGQEQLADGIASIANSNEPKETKQARMQQFLLDNKFIIEDSENKGTFIPHTGSGGKFDAQSLAANLDISVANNARENLVFDTSKNTDQKIFLKIDSSKAREDFILRSLGDITVGVSNEIKTELEALSTKLTVNIFNSALNELNTLIARNGDFSAFGAPDTIKSIEGLVFFVDATAATFASFGAFFDSVPETFESYEDKLIPLDTSDQNENNQKVKAFPEPSPREVTNPIPETITDGSLEKASAAAKAGKNINTKKLNIEPIDPQTARKNVNTAISVLEEQYQAISDSAFGAILKIISDFGVEVNNFFDKVENIIKAQKNAFEVVSTLSASYPDFETTFNYGLDFTNVTGSDNINLYNKYEFVVKKNGINYISTGGQEKIPQDIMKFIKDNNLYSKEEFLNSKKCLQQYLFEKFLVSQNINSSISYKDLKNNFMFHIFQDIKNNSQFFQVEESQAYGNTIKVAKIAKLLLEETTDADKIACGVNNNLADTDDIKAKVLDNFINDACNFQAPTPDGSRSKALDPVEKGFSNAFILFTIRVYLVDYYLKGIFPFDLIRPGFVVDNFSVDVLATYMESEMKGISDTYFSRFLDEIQRYYDNLFIKSADDLLKPKNELLRIKREKFKKILYIECLRLSRRLGTKFAQVAKTNFPTEALTTFDPYFNTLTLDPTKDYDEQETSEELETIKLAIQPQTLKHFTSPFDLIREKESMFRDINLFINAARFNSIQLNNNVLKIGSDKNDPIYKFLFEFCFPVRKYYFLAMLHCILAQNARPLISKIFYGTKTKLAGLHKNLMTGKTVDANAFSRSGVSYDNLSNIGNLTEDLKKFVIQALIETPRQTIKSTVEGGGSLIGFLGSLPNTITKPIWLSLFNKLPYNQPSLLFPAHLLTPIAMGFLSSPLVGLWPLFSSLDAAYLITLGWFEEEYYTEPSKKPNNITEFLFDRVGRSPEEICAEVNKSKTFEEILAIAAKSLDKSGENI